MKVLDLFAGIGGFSLAAHWMGWETAAFVEKEPFCQKVLAKNFKGVPIYGDIFEFDGTGFRGAVDVVCGGFPCQPFSAAGKRNGVNDERYLFPETLRVIAEVRPSWVVLENVTGLVSMAQSSRTVGVARQANHRFPDEDVYEAIYTQEETMLLNRICEELENEGYAVQSVVVPALALGAPHRRDRIWIVANAKSERVRRTIGNVCKKERGSGGALLFGTDGADCGNDASDSESERSRKAGSDCGRSEERIAGGDPAHDASDTPCKHGVTGRDGGMEAGSSERTARVFDAERCSKDGIWSANWLDVALRTCVRGMDARFSDWLDEFGGRINGTSDKAISRQDLRNLRQYIQQEEVWQEIGRCFPFLEQKNVFTVLRQLNNHSDSEHIPFSGEEISERCLRDLQYDRESSYAPQGWRCYAQYRNQHRDPLWELSFEIALATESLVWRWQKENSRDNRTARLKALGNSIVPQIALEIFKAIEAAGMSLNAMPHDTRLWFRMKWDEINEAFPVGKQSVGLGR